MTDVEMKDANAAETSKEPTTAPVAGEQKEPQDKYYGKRPHPQL